MDEILRISDEVTIMRDGQYIGTWSSEGLTTDLIITKMVGREQNLTVGRNSLRNFYQLHLRYREASQFCFGIKIQVNFALMGENGAGKSTLMKCMFGIYHMDEGEVIYEGEKVQIKGPLDASTSAAVKDEVGSSRIRTLQSAETAFAISTSCI